MRNRNVLPLLVIAGALLVSIFAATPRSLAISEVTATPTPGAAPTLTPVPPQPSPTPLQILPTTVPTQVPGSTNVDDLIDQAVQAFQFGQFNQAIDLLNQALEIDPRNAEALAVRGIVYSQQGDFNRGVDDLTRAIEIVPYMWTYYTLRGDAFVALRELGQAMQDYDQSILLNPRYERAYRSRSALLFAQGDSTNATIDDLIAQGLASSALQNNSQAVEFFSAAIETRGGSTASYANAYYNRGLARYLSGDVAGAIPDYTSSLEFMSNMHDSYLARGIARRETGDLLGAGEDFMRRIEILEANTTNDSISANTALDVAMAYGNVYRLTFSGLGGESVTLSARDLDGVSVDPLIVLLGPDGVVLAGDDDFGGELDSLIADFRLPRDGTYTLVVSHANGGYDGTVRVLVEKR